jgi:hypothetical protein
MLRLSLLVLALTTGDVRISPQGDGSQVEVLADLPAEVAAKLSEGKLTQDDGEALLEFRLVTDGKEGPPMLGSYAKRGKELAFVPRFPLQPDKTYRARLTLAGAKPVTMEYKVPPRAPAPAAEVKAVWPTADILPANNLRFYIQFSGPMRGGPEIFKQIQLQDSDGKEIEDAWLRDELWSDDGTLLVLYIHPGRIKWGVLLRLLLGPVLVPDRQYTLVVGGTMLDANGRMLGKDYKKAFRTTAEDRTRIELSKWKIEAPRLLGKDALTFTFATNLDHMGLERFLAVTDAKGQAVEGKVEVARDGRGWKFVPSNPWTAQDYVITVDPQLEDVAANTPTRPFDMDGNAPAAAPQRLTLTFRPHQ